jgi:hypothetical protein
VGRSCRDVEAEEVEAMGEKTDVWDVGGGLGRSFLLRRAREPLGAERPTDMEYCGVEDCVCGCWDSGASFDRTVVVVVRLNVQSASESLRPWRMSLGQALIAEARAGPDAGPGSVRRGRMRVEGQNDQPSSERRSWRTAESPNRP